MKKLIAHWREKLFKTCVKSNKIVGFNRNLFTLLLFPFLGLVSLFWLLVRLVPKPSRAAYPCMKIAFPLASSFLVWIAGLLGSFVFFKHVRERWHLSKFITVTLFVGIAVTILSLSVFPTKKSAYSGISATFVDPYGPNAPIGQAKGIIPGRVVWAWNPDATNEKCRPSRYGDGYFLDKNCNQDIVDAMLANALLKLTEQQSEQDAWDALFRYFNKSRGKGDVGYSPGETIFIKINAVHAWSTNNDGSIQNNSNYGNVDTSPHAVLAMLRQLVHKAGVPQENIYIGDPLTHIFKHNLEKWRADFPNIHYMDKSGIDGRERYAKSRNYMMKFSDQGAVLDESEDDYFKVIENSDYLLNIPAMKGHEWAGVTFFAKNFFGAHTRSGAGHMHPGLILNGGYNEPMRDQYGMYRVFVDLMGHENLGGKTLIYFMDGLWATSHEHEPPVKFQMAPFNNDWSNSIFLSLDPVAIESVCLDILQAEFPKTKKPLESGNNWCPNYPAVDDYLHQAADPQNWPEDIVYDPEGDGTPLGSLGVHEHWNNPCDQQYSANLGSKGGIELVKIHSSTRVKDQPNVPHASFVLEQNYPNPFNPATEIKYELTRGAKVSLTVYNSNGQKIRSLVNAYQNSGWHSVQWDGQGATGLAAASGVYFYQLVVDDGYAVHQQTRRMMLIK